jgi:pimeloyl-ACP methyl ester carboxylesterase
MKHSQIAVGDVELHVVEIGAGKPLLFCHGFPDVWIGWRRQMEAVAAAGYRAIAVDMRGYGRSTGPENPTAYTMFHTVGDMVGLLDALELPTVTIVGHDFGAATVWYAAMMHPDRFTAVFGISVPYPHHLREVSSRCSAWGS